MMNKPDFFIVGTPKSGTTSLFNYLEEHPEVFVPMVKEPHYFSQPEVANTYYKTTLIDTLQEYLHLYKEAGKFKAIGDLSSSYLFHGQSALRIREFNPEAKIIIILRNPAERAVSHYLMDLHLDLIQKPLQEVLSHPEENTQFYEQYVELGMYSRQVENYLKTFGAHQVLLLLSDELFLQTEKTIARIFEFLGVDATFKPDFSKKYNQFKEPRFKFVGRIKNAPWLQGIFTLLPGGIRRWAAKAAFDTNKKKPSFEQESLMLNKIFLKDIERTEAVVGKDLKSWKGAQS